MNAIIHVEEFELPCFVGVYDFEKQEPQKLYLSLKVTLDITQAVKSDSIHQTIDYDQLVNECVKVSQKQHYHLIETLAFEITETLFAHFPLLSSFWICLKKPQAIKKAKCCSVILERSR